MLRPFAGQVLGLPLDRKKKGECCVDVLIVRRAPSKRANGFFVATDIVDGALFVSSQ